MNRSLCLFKRSYAFTLVEMLLVMSLLSALSIGAVGLLIRVKQASATIEARFSTTRSLARLSRTWRRDVQVCEQIKETADEDVFFSAVDPGGDSVVYRLVSASDTLTDSVQTVQREWTRDQQILGRDSFSIPLNATTQTNAFQIGDSTFASLIITASSGQSDSQRTVLNAESRTASLPGLFQDATGQESSP